MDENLGNIFYVYVYPDLRKPGKYKYGEFQFDFEPFYVGKGSYNRLFSHLWEAGRDHGENQDKIDRINEILAAGFAKEDFKKYIIKYRVNMNNPDAIDLEIKMIATIGRGDLGEGPLTNHTDGGEDPPIMRGENHPSFGKIGGLSPVARAVIAEGKPFPAIIVASRELKIYPGTISYRVNTGKEGYSWADDTPEDIEARRRENIKRGQYGGNNPNARSCMAEWKSFSSIADASRELNISSQLIIYRIKIGKEGYSYLKK